MNKNNVYLPGFLEEFFENEEPENVYPEDDWGVQDDLAVDSYIEDSAFND